jgi:HK97 gp10 family phage protein
MAQSIERLKARLAAIPKAVKEDVQKTLLKQATDLADSMRHLAPVDTGALRDSIAVTPGGQSTPPYSQPGGEHAVPENAVCVTAGNEAVRYPHLVEYGTTGTDPQPFFWPAYRIHKRRIKNAIGRSIGKAVKKHWIGS